MKRKSAPWHIAEGPLNTLKVVIFGYLELVFSATRTRKYGCMATIEAFDFPNQDLVSEVKNLCPNRSYDHFTDPPKVPFRGSIKPVF